MARSFSPSLSGEGGIDAAYTAAARRWSAALHERFSATPELYGKVIEAIDITLQSAATAAEMKKPGTGLVYIVEELRARDVAGSRDAHTAVKDELLDPHAGSSATHGEGV